MDRFICVACGTQFADSDEPPASCPICSDPRQYIPEGGQRWTTSAELASERENHIRDEGDLVGIGTEPWFAIGQRALLVPFGDSNLLWDCISLLDDVTAQEVDRRGGLAGIAISHPHYYSSMVEWAHLFDCPIHLHAADAEWVMRPDPARSEEHTSELQSHRDLHSFPPRRSSDLAPALLLEHGGVGAPLRLPDPPARGRRGVGHAARPRDPALGRRTQGARPWTD